MFLLNPQLHINVLLPKLLNKIIILPVHKNQNNTTSDNFSNDTYEVYVPSIDNEWKYYSIKDGEEFFNSNHNRSIKKTLKKHLQKLNDFVLGRVI